MSQQKWIRGPICGIDNCRSKLYRQDAGRKFCQFGHMAEGNLEIDDEDGEFSQTKRLNISLTDTGFGSQATSATKKAGGISSRKSKQRYFGKEGRVFVFKCLQHLLREIAPKVIQHLYKDLGSDVVDSLLASIKPVLKLFWIRCVKKTFHRLLPNIGDLYVLVYLALRQINRYPVFFDQYLQMLCKNEVPFIDARRILTPSMRSVIPTGSHDLFEVLWLPLDDYFYTMVARWSVSLSLRGLSVTPLDYSYPMVLKIIIDLRIPHAPQMLALYHEISMIITGGIIRQLTKMCSGSIEAQIIGLLHLAVRLYFSASPEVLDVKQWIDWLSQDEELPFIRNRTQMMTDKEIMNLTKKQISEYLDWVNDTLVSEAYKDPESDSLTVMEKKLAQIFSYQTSDGSQSNTNLYVSMRTVENTLTFSELAQIETHLEKYFCSRFGIKPSTLKDVDHRLKKRLPKRLWRSHNRSGVTSANTN